MEEVRAIGVAVGEAATEEVVVGAKEGGGRIMGLEIAAWHEVVAVTGEND